MRGRGLENLYVAININNLKRESTEVHVDAPISISQAVFLPPCAPLNEVELPAHRGDKTSVITVSMVYHLLFEVLDAHR